nr:stage VI sporulation protein D [Evansella caseinilytica]
MTHEPASSLSFSIKEQVWLNRGSEIDEILSIALEPDISIREADDQVFVRGSLQLFGEYRPKVNDDLSIEQASTLTKEVSFRSVEEVSMTDDGLGIIRHSFPLDVTIPKEKIHRLDDLYVTVDAFDYELPGDGCIELEANVSVTGIKSERSDFNEVEPKEGNEGIADGAEDEERTEAFASDGELEQEPVHLKQADQEAEEEDSFHLEAVRQAADESEEAAEQQDRDAPFFDGDHAVVEPSEEEMREKDSSDKAAVEPTVTFSALQNTPESAPAQKTAEKHGGKESGRTNVHDAGTEKKEENALYLTKMLTKGEEEFSKLRICIVQEGESLESIAARYDIQVSQLLRMNRLNDERVAGGQILYIPVRQLPSSKT